MNKFSTPEEAFTSQNFDPSAVKIEGCPEQHLEAAKAFINLCVAHDAVNPEFQPDFTNSDQWKYEVDHFMGSPSGVGFSYLGYGHWFTVSGVGARLVSESRKSAEHIGELFHEDFKKMKVYERKIQK